MRQVMRGVFRRPALHLNWTCCGRRSRTRIGSAGRAFERNRRAGAASKAVNLREDAQYVCGGYQYCWYDAGWRGPGWYRCGFSWRRGYGWGGPLGWRGWRHGDRRFYGERRFDRSFRGGGGPGPAVGRSLAGRGPAGGGVLATLRRKVARPGRSRPRRGWQFGCRPQPLTLALSWGVGVRRFPACVLGASAISA